MDKDEQALSGTPAQQSGAIEMSGAEMVIEALADQGAEHLFGYPGGAVLPIYDALYNEPRLTHVLVRHEQGATHAAEGYARSTGKPGVVLVTSGPGATNAITGVVGMPSVSIGMKLVCAAALLALSGPATPRMLPWPKGTSPGRNLVFFSMV